MGISTLEPHPVVKLSAVSAFSAFSAVKFPGMLTKEGAPRRKKKVRPTSDLFGEAKNITAENAEKAENAESFTIGCGSNVLSNLYNFRITTARS